MTRTKTASPDMITLYVILPGHDKVTSAARVTTGSRKFKAPILQTKIQKTKDLP